MFHELVSHNEDLKRLVEKGYAVGFDSGHLVVRDVPYLDHEKKLQRGAFVTKLEFVDRVRVKQQDHQVFFCGSPPHTVDGAPIPNLGGGPVQVALKDPALIVQRSFSNKPLAPNGTHDPNGFPDFFAKIESYTRIIWGPAQQLYPDATPLTFKVDKEVTTGSVFKFSGRPSGPSRTLRQGRRSRPQSEAGSSRASRTTGSPRARSSGRPCGVLIKLNVADAKRRNADERTTTPQGQEGARGQGKTLA